MLSYKISNKITPPSLENLKLHGSIAEQMNTFFNERVRSDFARDVILDECERQFVLRNDDETPVGWWRGEFWGKWAISGARVARYTGDEKLKQTLLDSAMRVIATADEDGYIGSYKDKTNVLPADIAKTYPIMGWPCIWNWNLWGRKYTLWGLLEIYDLTGDERILTAAVRSTDQIIAMLDKLGLKPSDCGTFNGLPVGSTLKPLLILYRITENPRYLDFALKIASDWEREDGKVPNLITNALSMKPLHDWYEKPHLWAKAYEMMSCFDGLIELYRVTGDEKYLATVENAYTLLYERDLNALFSVGFNDQFVGGAVYQNTLTEPCDVIHWIRMCYELYTLTGELKYIDTIERAFYNPFLAGSFADGKWGARAVRCFGRHMVAVGQAGMDHSHCCVNNMPRGYLSVAECFVMEKSGRLLVNLYSEFECTIGGKKVTIDGDYLSSGRVTVTVDSDEKGLIGFRIPAWSKTTQIDGESMSCPASYVYRELSVGLNRFSLEFDMRATIREFEFEQEHYPTNDYRINRFITENAVRESDMMFDRRVTILRGPLLLTRSKLVGNSEAEMFGVETIRGKSLTVSAEPIESDKVRAAFRVKFEGEGGFETNMCDFATGSNIWSEDDDRLFNIYL